MTDQDTSDLPSVREQLEMTAEINERIRKRGECVWTNPEYSEDYWWTQCGQKHIPSDGNPVTDEGKNWCAYCGGKLVTK